MKWVLIIALGYSTTVTVPYDSLDACKRAGDLMATGTYISYCTNTSTGETLSGDIVKWSELKK